MGWLKLLFQIPPNVFKGFGVDEMRAAQMGRAAPNELAPNAPASLLDVGGEDFDVPEKGIRPDARSNRPPPQIVKALISEMKAVVSEDNPYLDEQTLTRALELANTDPVAFQLFVESALSHFSPIEVGLDELANQLADTGKSWTAGGLAAAAAHGAGNQKAFQKLVSALFRSMRTPAIDQNEGRKLSESFSGPSRRGSNFELMLDSKATALRFEKSLTALAGSGIPVEAYSRALYDALGPAYKDDAHGRYVDCVGLFELIATTESRSGLRPPRRGVDIADIVFGLSGPQATNGGYGNLGPYLQVITEFKKLGQYSETGIG